MARCPAPWLIALPKPTLIRPRPRTDTVRPPTDRNPARCRSPTAAVGTDSHPRAVRAQWRSEVRDRIDLNSGTDRDPLGVRGSRAVKCQRGAGRQENCQISLHNEIFVESSGGSTPELHEALARYHCFGEPILCFHGIKPHPLQGYRTVVMIPQRAVVIIPGMETCPKKRTREHAFSLMLSAYQPLLVFIILLLLFGCLGWRVLLRRLAWLGFLLPL